MLKKWREKKGKQVNKQIEILVTDKNYRAEQMGIKR